MAKFLQSKCHLCRQEGIKLFLKGERCYSPKCPLERKGAVPPGQHGAKRRRRLSEYGVQLREKQKTKRAYGVLERQFQRYYKEATRFRGIRGEVLLRLLELRLDNVLFRLGFVPSRSVGRQLVSHGHVLVDNKKVNIPSFQVKVDQIISLSPTALNIKEVKKAIGEKEKRVPKWLNRKAIIGKIVKLPKREEIDIDIDENLIIEFYSR